MRLLSLCGVVVCSVAPGVLPLTYREELMSRAQGMRSSGRFLADNALTKETLI